MPDHLFWYPFLSGLPFLKGGQKMKEGKKERRTFHQIGHNQRTSILAMLEMGFSIQEIAKRLHRHPSTIYREIRRYPVSKEGDGYQYGKGCKDLGGKYLVCNQCPKHFTGCLKDRTYYNPTHSHEESHRKRHEKNQGPRLSKKEFDEIDSILYDRILKGQSIEHIWHTCEEVRKVSIITIRRWISCDYMKAKPIHLRRKKRYKKAYDYRQKKADLGANAQMKLGRTMDDYTAYVEEHPDHLLIQTDSVEGKTSDKLRLLTVMFVETGFQLAFIYAKAAASEEVISRLLSIMRDVRSRTRRPIVLLTDNGTEFSYVTQAEEVDDLHVFFADPYKSTDKSNCERNHEMIRFIIPKGYTLDGLTQDKVDEIMSNVNSYARDSLNWKKPVELMRQAFGDELLQKWRIREIPSSEVYLRSMF